MTWKKIRWKLLLALLILGMLLDMVIFHLKGPIVLKSDSKLPDYDHSKDPFYFDFYKEEWVYKNERESPTKGFSKPRRYKRNYRYKEIDPEDIEEYDVD